MYDFHVKPETAMTAIETLATYVAERASLLNDEGGRKLESVQVAVKMMDALFRFKELLQANVKTPCEKAYDTLRFTTIPTLMDEAGMPSVTLAGIGRVNLQNDVSVKVDDPDGLRKWLTANDFEDMIKPTVNNQTLAAFVRERIKEVKDLPESITVTPLVRAVITRSGVKT